MCDFTLYRKRFIPNELILLDQDQILEVNSEYMVTSWKSIKPRKDLSHGASIYYFNKGIKISKFYNHENNLICWYCDIVAYDNNPKDHTLTVIDLLADVLVYPDASYVIRDLDELAEAKELGLITEEQLSFSLRSLDLLLRILYDKKFNELQSPFDDFHL